MQRIELVPRPVTRSCPLRTGKDFLLVLPALRLTQARWDKSEYSPGETAQLSIEGHQLAKMAPLEVVVERADEGGAFGEIARVEPRLEGDKASAEFRLRRIGLEKFAAGHLVAAEFSQPALARGEPVELRVRAEGLEGATLELIVEREDDEGRFEPVAKLAAAVQQGKASARWSPPALPPAPPLLGPCRFLDAELRTPTAACEAVAQGLDGQFVQIVLEREVDGQFVEVSSTSAKVQDGKARASLPLERG